MLDINLIRETPDVVRKALKDRQMDTSPWMPFCSWMKSAAPCSRRWKCSRRSATLSRRRSGKMKEAAARQSKIEAMRVVGDKIAEFDKEVGEVEAELNALTASIAEHPRCASPLRKR